MTRMPLLPAGTLLACIALLLPATEATALLRSSAHGASSPADPNATEATTVLLRNLQTISSSTQFVFGHHNSNVEGETWSAHMCGTSGHAPCNRSDVLAVTGHHPGMVELNLQWAVHPYNSNIVPAARAAIAQASILQLYWQADNPVTGGNANDLRGNPAVNVMPGGSANAKWVVAMDRVAAFLKDIQVPAVVLRLFHENTGSWFWWGASSTTPAQYRALYNYTVSYLRSKGVHNALLAYAPATPSQFGDSFIQRYPGDGLIDVVCFDRYEQTAAAFTKGLLADCAATESFASQHNKVFAVCEFGCAKGLQQASASDAEIWYTSAFLEPAMRSRSCGRMAWALTWRNSKSDSYWVPLKGQPGHADFVAFANNRSVLFAGEVC